MSDVDELTQLRRIRAGKKGAITKRTNTITRLISEGGSRTKIKYLHQALLKVHESVKDVCAKITQLTELSALDVEWLERVDHVVDCCTAEVEEYFEARKDDEASTTVSMTNSWVAANAAGTGEEATEDEALEQDLAELDALADTTAGIPLRAGVSAGDIFTRHTSEASGMQGLIDRLSSANMLATSSTHASLQPSLGGFGPPASDSFSSRFPSSTGFRYGHYFNETNEYQDNVPTSGYLRGPQFSRYRDCDKSDAHSTKSAPTSKPAFGSTTLRPSMLRFPHSSAAVRAPTSFHATYSAAGLRPPNQHSTVFSNLPARFASMPQRPLHAPVPTPGNEVDSWIDDLDEKNPQPPPDITNTGITADVTMAWLVQQSLPIPKIPTFDGSAVLWVPFITRFFTRVHKQAFLSDEQRSMYLLDNLDGEAKRSVSGYTHDTRGYILSLKRLKFLFGQRNRIAQAYISSVTRGKQVLDDDGEALGEFYYSVSDCLVALSQLNYASDLYSSDTLRQAVRRLPSRLHMKWAEHGLRIRQRGTEPNLLDFEAWLQCRVLAYRDSFSKDPSTKRTQNKSAGNRGGSKDPDDLTKSSLIGLTGGRSTGRCLHCKGKHKISRCEIYLKLTPTARYDSVKTKKLCFNCLGVGHDYPSCPSKNTCNTSDCDKKHHTSLHDHFISVKKEEGKDDAADLPATVDSDASNGVKETHHSGHVRSKKKDTYLMIVPVVLRSPIGEDIFTYALLDDGSESSLLRKDIARRLQLIGVPQPLSVTTVVQKVEQPLSSEATTLTVYSKSMDFKLEIESVAIVPAERFNMPTRPRLADSDYFTHLDDIVLDAVSPDEIGLLIGGDEGEAHIQLDVRRGRKDQPLAIKTPFGWTLFGSSRTCNNQSPCSTKQISHLHVPPTPNEHVNSAIEELWTVPSPARTHVNCISTKPAGDPTGDSLQDLVERFWMQEHTAILPEKDNLPSAEDRLLLEKLDRETYLDDDGHYVVPMLWDEKVTQLPDNAFLARKRFDFLRRKLRADPELYALYDAVFKSYITNGFARRLSEEEAANTSTKTCTLPHHPVVNPNKPGEIRVVMDAAATCEGISLNTSLKTGPDLLNPLVGVIMRFRTHKVAIAADIKAMFHQVRTPECDRDALRFLWTDDIYSDDEPYTMQMLVHIFGAKDSPTCANYAVKRTARDNYKLFDPLTYETVLKAFYVDDLLKSVQSEDIAISLARELVAMMKRGGFHLTKFLSNSRAVLDSLPASEISPKMKLDLDAENIQRALGILWDEVTDRFIFLLKLPDAPMTKRGIIRVTCSFFDPMGFITAFILIAKILVQELWRRGYGWDDEIDEESQNFWRRWLDAAANINKVYVDRCYSSYLDDSIVEVQLHIFCDASEAAYGSVAYFRFSLKAGGHVCRFILSKSKLAPIKAVTLPRLELSAAVTAVRMYKTIIRETDLPVERVGFWTDSTLTLQYITNTTHRPKAFVANRQTEINEATNTCDWKHVPSGENPADLLTRGVHDPAQLMETSANGTSWFSGPAFLKEEEETWPVQSIGQLDAQDPEIRKKSVLVGLGIVARAQYGMVIDPRRFSTWTKLKRVVGWVRRFIKNFTAKCQSKPGTSGDLSCDEIEAAEIATVRLVQADSFTDELHILKGGGTLPIKNKISPLSPFIDDAGVLRVGGRIVNAPIPHNAKHQLILPKDHPVTKLIIIHEHRRNAHVGREHVLASLREKFWIVNGRSAVKSALRKCFLCRFRKARQQYPYMSNLPHGRVAYEEPPFSHCGVDLFGPIIVKQGRKRLKRWAVLYTCLTVRCVHLEVVEAIDTDTFIDCLRRFTNRRGCPKFMYSDCGTNFKGASTELTDAIALLDSEKIEQYATSEKIVWTFNPPSAPHMGGAWERLVRSSKEVLFALMKNHTLTDAQLYTLLTEVENILNRRPLTHSSDDPNDLTALTPNHILLGLHRNWDYACEVDDRDVTSRRKFRQVQAIANRFWRQWRDEYLPKLTKRGRWTEHLPNLTVGELVVLAQDEVKRGKWPLARITKVCPSEDGVVRVVEVRTKDGTYTRPVAKICKLEDNE